MSTKRPGRERRDLSVLLACRSCGALFHPWLYHKNAAYCSRTCRSQAAVKSAIAAAAAKLGITDTMPATPPTPPAPPTSSQVPDPPPPPPAVPAPTPELPSLVTSQAWYQAGERRRQLAEALLTPDARATTRRDQVLVLSGDGAALKVRRGS